MKTDLWVAPPATILPLLSRSSPSNEKMAKKRGRKTEERQVAEEPQGKKVAKDRKPKEETMEHKIGEEPQEKGAAKDRKRKEEMAEHQVEEEPEGKKAAKDRKRKVETVEQQVEEPQEKGTAKDCKRKEETVEQQVGEESQGKGAAKDRKRKEETVEQKVGEGSQGKRAAKDRKRKDVYIYGNYKTYYSYRIDRNLEEDPRLAALKKEWFEGKDCLDIGCNQGLITISIAKKFFCRRILGIDIDRGLIENANWNLQKLAKIKQVKSKVTKGPLNGTNCLDLEVSQSSNEEMVNFSSDACNSAEECLLSRISFKKENFVQSLYGCAEKYDTILCWSVTKWIHLNWGDDGLITLFVKIWRLLRPGGLLLLEPQPWSSYSRKRLVSETARENFNNILLRPHTFREILLDKIGFRSAEVITDNLSGSVTGFNRPIIAFYK